MRLRSGDIASGDGHAFSYTTIEQLGGGDAVTRLDLDDRARLHLHDHELRHAREYRPSFGEQPISAR